MKEWICGRRPVMEHLRLLPGTVEKIVIAEGAKPDGELFPLISKAGIKVEKAQKARLDQLVPGENHQGIAALVAGLEYADLDEIIERTKRKDRLPLIIALDSVQDPRNLGAVIRVADGAGAAGVVIPKDRAAGLTASAARSAAGAAASVPVARVVNLARCLDALKKEGFTIIGAAHEAEKTLDETKFFFPAVLVMGSEGAGLRPNVAGRVDHAAKLPMRGAVSSLNIAVAAGIFSYEIGRRYFAAK